MEFTPSSMERMLMWSFIRVHLICVVNPLKTMSFYFIFLCSWFSLNKSSRSKWCLFILLFLCSWFSLNKPTSPTTQTTQPLLNLPLFSKQSSPNPKPNFLNKTIIIIQISKEPIKSVLKTKIPRNVNPKMTNKNN